MNATYLLLAAALATGCTSAGSREPKKDGVKDEAEKREAAASRKSERDEIRERAEAGAADMILTNGNVITLDPKAPKAEAVAVKGDRILFVGATADAMKFRTRATQVIDLAGATVIPGLVDGHAHLASLGETLETVRLTDSTSWKQVVDLTAERAKATPKGEWIVGDGWDQNDWAGGKAFPVHTALSARFRLTPSSSIASTATRPS